MEGDMGRSGSSSKKRKMWLFKRLKMKESWRWRLRVIYLSIPCVSEEKQEKKTCPKAKLSLI
ncbi:hypothetical protein NC652_011360 [Populus alba x Populus x berolinensis]|nr:hypothetical protein NC652_011360 [Populus alba x Populus x berolinensis]